MTQASRALAIDDQSSRSCAVGIDTESSVLPSPGAAPDRSTGRCRRSGQERAGRPMGVHTARCVQRGLKLRTGRGGRFQIVTATAGRACFSEQGIGSEDRNTDRLASGASVTRAKAIDARNAWSLRDEAAAGGVERLQLTAGHVAGQAPTPCQRGQSAGIRRASAGLQHGLEDDLFYARRIRPDAAGT